MNIYSRLVVLIVFFALIVGCKAKSPSTSGSDESSSSDSSDSTATSYVGKWVKSVDNTIAMDWKSDSFIYMCLVSDYTYAAHGSYSSSSKRLTWWDGSYNTVSSSGSNILLDSATYEPAVLTSACNPFFTNYTSENTYYTTAAKAIGSWKFSYTIASTTFHDYPLMAAISTRRTSDNNYYNYGEDETGNIITGTYSTSTGNYDILMTGSIIDRYHVFSIASSNSSSSGCYYQYSHSSSSWSSCYSATGAKLYGTPRTYRTYIEQTSDEMMGKRVEEQIIKESTRGKRRLSDKDLNAFKRYKKLLQILKNTEKEPLKGYLKSFRSN